MFTQRLECDVFGVAEKLAYFAYGEVDPSGAPSKTAIAFAMAVFVFVFTFASFRCRIGEKKGGAWYGNDMD
ncbi:MAG: hypothetical protein IIW40_00170 [Clostridia bacterium]|nr:hypothetical protein [Clostridia bacterium]